MKLLFKNAYNDYLLYVNVKQKNQSKRTIEDVFKNHILPYWKNYNIYDITESDYINWQNIILSKNYKYTYLKKIHYSMSAIFEYLIKFKNLEKNIAKEVGCFKKSLETKIEHNYYNRKEFKKFIKNVDNEIYKIFFLFMFYTGTRPGEAMALKFSNINNNKISINKSIEEHIDKYTKKRIIGTTKNIYSNRIINIDRKLKNDILYLKKYYIKKYNNKNYDYFIFGGIKPLAPTSIRRNIKKASLKAGVKYIKIHEFRHSHASLLYKSGIPIIEISKRLGHNNITTTVNTYIHTDNKQEKRVIKTLTLIRLFQTF